MTATIRATSGARCAKRRTGRRRGIGEPMNKNLTIRAGNCNHRRYVPGWLKVESEPVA
jgi:hypothetical protein